jgi:hypothetical protein
MHSYGVTFATSFGSDPAIDRTDAEHLIKETSNSLRKLSKDRFVIESFAHSNV